MGDQQMPMTLPRILLRAEQHQIVAIDRSLDALEARFELFALSPRRIIDKALFVIVSRVLRPAA
jgi:hypothetical protein